MSRQIVLRLLCLVCVGVANAEQKPWTNLRVRYSVNPFSKYYYQNQPRQISELDPGAWTNLSGSDCRNGGKYSGFRYVEKDETPSMALLYDVQGTIAGIQMILDKAAIQANNDFRFHKVPSYNPDRLNGVDVYVLTAYLVEPSTICTTGRRSIELTRNGTGTVIQVQAGPTPENLLRIPRHVGPRAIAAGWSRHRCAIGQGYHYFYKFEEARATGCLENVPVFGLYDREGDQIGFGFAATGKAHGPHFENLSAHAIALSLGSTAPKCVLEKATDPGLTTMHVWFTEYPNLYTCFL